jgi:DNA-binding SARP family transcriptional activator
VDRSTVSGTLWLDVSERQARSSLRSALWRFGQVGHSILVQTGEQLALDTAVRVDLDDLTEGCLRITREGDPDILDWLPRLRASSEILPTWDEEWLVVERERYSQLRLHALDLAGQILLAKGQCSLAIDVGLAALESEPLHESAHRLIVEVHLREGNLTEAIRQYRRYERLLAEELGVAPSPQMEAIMEPLRAEGLR